MSAWLFITAAAVSVVAGLVAVMTLRPRRWRFALTVCVIAGAVALAAIGDFLVAAAQATTVACVVVAVKRRGARVDRSDGGDQVSPAVPFSRLVPAAALCSAIGAGLLAIVWSTAAWGGAFLTRSSATPWRDEAWPLLILPAVAALVVLTTMRRAAESDRVDRSRPDGESATPSAEFTRD